MPPTFGETVCFQPCGYGGRLTLPYLDVFFLAQSDPAAAISLANFVLQINDCVNPGGRNPAASTENDNDEEENRTRQQQAQQQQQQQDQQPLGVSVSPADLVYAIAALILARAPADVIARAIEATAERDNGQPCDGFVAPRAFFHGAGGCCVGRYRMRHVRVIFSKFLASSETSEAERREEMQRMFCVPPSQTYDTEEKRLEAKYYSESLSRFERYRNPVQQDGEEVEDEEVEDVI